MAVKEILQLGNPKLKRISKKVEKIDEDIKKLAKDLRDTLYSTTGIGLAAPQIGVNKRVIYIDLRDERKPILLINPRIVARFGKEKSTEGCLSYPGHEGVLIRPKKVTVKGLTLLGEEVEYVGEELLGKAFCHEIDHLDGVLYTDRATEVYEIED